MFLRNRVTGQVHDVPDHLVHGFHHAQEVDGFGEPLGLPFLAALAPMLTSILPAIGSLFKGGGEPTPAPAPAPVPVVLSPPPPPPMEPPEPRYRPRPAMMDRGSDDDMPVPRRATVPGDPGAPALVPGPTVIYRRKRRGRRAVRRVPLPSQVSGYGWWY